MAPLEFTGTTEPPPSAWLRYGFAVAAVAAAVGLRLVSAPVIGDHVFVVFFPAVILAAWYGGGGPAAVASLLAVFSAHFFFFPPPFSLAPAPATQAFQLALFLASAGLVGGVTSRLRDARAGAHDTARQLDAVIANAVDGIIVIDAGGRILRANRAATEIFGYGRRDLVGRNVSVLMPEPDRSRHDRYLERFRRTREARIIGSLRELKGRRRDGSIFPLELSVSETREGGEAVYTGIVRDITERKRAEERERLLAGAGEVLADRLEPDEALGRLTRLFAAEFCDYCVTYVRDGDTGIRRVGAAHSDPEREALVERLLDLAPLTLDDEFGAGMVIRTGEDVLASVIPSDLLERAAQNDEHLSILRQLRPISSMVLPLRARGRTLGAISFTTTEESGRVFGEADLQLARALAQRIALALDNLHLLEAAEARARELERSEVELRASQGRVRLALQAGGLGTWDWDLTEGDLRLSPSPGMLPGMELGQSSVTFDAFLDGVHPDDREAVTAAVDQVLGDDDTDYEVEFRVVQPDGEIRWFEVHGRAVKDGAGKPVRVTGVFTDVSSKRRERVRDQFLAAAGPALSRSLEFKATLRELAELAVPDIADWCVVSLLEDGVILPAAVCHRNEEHREALEQRVRARPPSLEATIGTGAVIRTGEPLMLRDVPQEAIDEAVRDDDDRRVLDQIALRSLIMVPLEARGQRFGCLTLGQSTSGRRFDEADLDFTTELARRAGVAADNAKLYERSEQERERAETAASARDDLLAIVSHDLRQPLNILAAALSLLEEGILPQEKQPVMFGRARRGLEQANRLIEDLLDTARSRSGNIELVRKEVDVGDVAREVADDLALHSDVEVVLDIAAALEAVSADRERLRRVFSNLLSNAIKHSPSGERVSLQVEEDGGGVLVRVSDAGRGIAPEDQPRVFDRYWHGRDGRDGLGLGLAIAREIVEAHGGRIWLESEPGQGTTFFVWLPSSRRRDEGREHGPHEKGVEAGA